MKDKKDGRNRASYTNGYNLNPTNSPLATSTTEKDDLTLRPYHHQGYYQPTTYQSQIDYNPPPTTNYYNSLPPTSYDNYYYHHHHQQQSDQVLSPFI
jgi:hypothetical protein